jgi:hypothetical protein
MAKRPALDPETLRLRRLSAGELADEIGELQARVDTLKTEAIRRELSRAQGAAFRIVLTPPGTQMRTDKARLLEVMGISAAEFNARFCNETQTGWRLTCSALRPAQPHNAETRAAA